MGFVLFVSLILWLRGLILGGRLNHREITPNMVLFPYIVLLKDTLVRFEIR